jgi:hypothetical protein
MNDFHPIAGRLLIHSGGVYKHADLFQYDRQIFAKYGTGFIAVKANKTTSKHKVYWRDIELDAAYSTKIGNLTLDEPRALKVAGER